MIRRILEELTERIIHLSDEIVEFVDRVFFEEIAGVGGVLFYVLNYGVCVVAALDQNA